MQSSEDTRSWFKKKRFLLPIGFSALILFASQFSATPNNASNSSTQPASVVQSFSTAASPISTIKDTQADVAPIVQSSVSPSVSPVVTPPPPDNASVSTYVKDIQAQNAQNTIDSQDIQNTQNTPDPQNTSSHTETAASYTTQTNTTDTTNTNNINTDNSLSNNNYYTNTSGDTVHAPAYSNSNTAPANATAQCGDGTYSFSESHRGTCSHHGGVAHWL